MPIERATVFEGAQIGLETTPGTPVSANKRLQDSSVELIKPVIPAKAFRPYGSKASSSTIRGKGHGEGRIVAAMSPVDLSYWMNIAVSNPAISTPGGGVTTRDREYKMRNFAPDLYKTATIDKGSFAAGERASFAAINGFQFNVNVNEEISQFNGNLLTQIPASSEIIYPAGHEVVSLIGSGTVSSGTFTLDVDGQTTGALDWDSTAGEIQTALEALSSVGAGNVSVSGGPLPASTVYIVFHGDLYGMNVDDVVADSGLIGGGGSIAVTIAQQGATITTLPSVPLGSADFDVYAALDPGDLPTSWTPGADSSSLLRCSMFGMEIVPRFKPGKYLRTDHPSYSALIEKNIEGSAIRLAHQANQEGKEFLDHLEEGTRVFVRALGLGPVIEGSLRYGVEIDSAFEVLDWDPTDNDGEYDAGISGEIVHDADLGAPFIVRTRTALAAPL